MKKTYNEIVNALIPGLTELSETKTTGKIAINVQKTLKEAIVVNEAYQKQRSKIIESKCLMDGTGKPKTEKNELGGYDYVFPSEAIKLTVQEELANLLNTEVEINIYQISYSDIEKIEFISAKTIFMLGSFVEN